MSEYQYYEFQAVDQPLTCEQMTRLRNYSSRAEITPSSFQNVYNYGSFKGDPDEWMEEYFDAFLYLANWGSRWFMLRLPKKLLAPQSVASYTSNECFSYSETGNDIILSFRSEDEDTEWEEGEGWLGTLVQTRSDLLRGDHRALYLGWLLAVQSREIEGDALEPPVPPGLGSLNASLDRLADFLRIDSDLIAAAAESSPDRQAAELTEKEIGAWLRDLPAEEKDEILVKLIDGNAPHLAAEVRQRIIVDVRGVEKQAAAPPRTADDISARADTLAETRTKREAEQRAREKARREREAAEARKRRLESLVGKEISLWAGVDKLIATKLPKRYDEAVATLKDLQALAAMQGTSDDFVRRMRALHSEHAKKHSLIERFRTAGLPG